MHSINTIIIIILTACLMPYVFSIIARMASGYDSKIHDNPRQHVNNAKGLAARANAVQKNSFEGLPLFLTAMLMADYLVVKDELVIQLGLAYIVLRIIYSICYLTGQNTLRSIFWLLATLCPVMLLFICMRA